jgi:hypothetical protein
MKGRKLYLRKNYLYASNDSEKKIGHIDHNGVVVMFNSRTGLKMKRRTERARETPENVSNKTVKAYENENENETETTESTVEPSPVYSPENEQVPMEEQTPSPITNEGEQTTPSPGPAEVIQTNTENEYNQAIEAVNLESTPPPEENQVPEEKKVEIEGKN